MNNRKSIHRTHAITALAVHEMSAHENRMDVVQHLHENFNWTGDLSQQITYSWDEKLLALTPDNEPDLVFRHIVSTGLSDVFISGNFGDIMNSAYDLIVTEYSNREYQFWDNEQLRDELLSIGYAVSLVTGTLKHHACPCCGKNTLTERHAWDICPVCWWEDDGTDNADASIRFSGPNNGLQLTQARINFIQYGIYNPERTDLLEKSSLHSNFEQGRVFVIDENKNRIMEQGTKWFAVLNHKE